MNLLGRLVPEPWRPVLALAPRLTKIAPLLGGLAGLCESLALVALAPLLELVQGAPLGAVGRFALGLAPAGADPWTVSLALFAGLGLSVALVRLGNELVKTTLRAELEEALGAELAAAYTGMDWPRYVALKPAETTNALTMEGHQIALGAFSLVQAQGEGLACLVLGAAAFAVAPTLALYALGFAALAGGVYALVDRLAGPYADALSGAFNELSARIGTLFGELGFLRAQGGERAALGRVLALYRIYKKNTLWSNWFGSLRRFILEAGGAAFIVGLFLVLSRSSGETGAAAGAVVFLGIFYRLAPRLYTVGDNLHQFRLRRAHLALRSARLTEARKHPTPRTGTAPPRFETALAFDRVAFHWPGRETAALAEVSFTVPRRGLVGLCGASGSGKSTLFALASGLVQPESGRLLLDGVDVRELDAQALKRLIGVVPQTPPLFNASIAENVAETAVWFGEPPDRKRVEAALESARLLDFVRSLPKGLDAPVGERGQALSGGQGRRLAIARALYTNPALLLLDEPGAGLDHAVEAELFALLTELKRERGILVSGHRLASLGHCDRLIALEAGRVAFSGAYAKFLGLPLAARLGAADHA